MSHLKVAVRVRPMLQREIDSQSVSVINIHSSRTIAVTNLKVPEQNAGDSRERIKRFTFDYCFHSESTQNNISAYVGSFKSIENEKPIQNIIFNFNNAVLDFLTKLNVILPVNNQLFIQVYESIGNDVKEAIRRRFHSCVLAYGQSSTGKTHTMMGTSDDSGLIPRLCRNVFQYLQESSTGDEFDDSKIFVSYLEIYNEKVKDLLSDRNASLRVREHPKKGPYVQGLSEHPALNSDVLLNFLDRGNCNRRVAATLTNSKSSRSHSVFTITFSSGVKLHLVDLAGSERAGHKYYSASRFKEGANINKSLVALGNVISTLAECAIKNWKVSRKKFVPYRDSVLTWLLKDTLGGNSKTVMIATVSPSSTCYSETVNTLRFGQRAKRIISQPVVNEDPKEKIIRELRAEIIELKKLLDQKLETVQIPVELTPEENIKSESDSAISTCSQFSKSSEPLCVKTETLTPIMSFSDIKTHPKKPTPVLRRAATSVLSDNAKPPLFGSLEALANPSTTKTDLLRKNISSIRKKSLENEKKKLEKGVGTDVKPPLKSVVVKKASKPRSAIVAAVTNRLYAKKKEMATETEPVKTVEEEKEKDLQICSNARLRLKEITQMALRANRRRSIETQTDLAPVLILKEMSTDMSDLKVELGEVKDAETDTRLSEMIDVGIDCVLLDNFQRQSNKNVFVVTRSCGTQSSEENRPNQKSHAGVSFTKYLQNTTQPKFEIVNPCTANPIYTSTVNINVSHNYINRPTDNLSDDSLENQPNVCFPTPDLISNHNSLEPHNAALQESSKDEIKHAICQQTGETFTTSENLIPTLSEICVANCKLAPVCEERIENLQVPSFAPEIYISDICQENCKFFNDPEPIRPQTVENDVINSAIVQEATILKSTTKEPEVCKCSNFLESGRIVKAMSDFIAEATNLMSNLTSVANKLDAVVIGANSDHTYDLQVTVNEATKPRGKRRKNFKRKEKKSTSVQTSPKRANVSTETENFQPPTNKYEKLVSDSCDKLEKCINRVERGEEKSSPYPINWGPKQAREDSSLDSNVTFSDYGSLPRRRRTPSCSPSAYLKHLTSMRRYVIESSREDLRKEGGSKTNF